MRLGGRQARVEVAVHEQPPHLLERHLPHQVLDVDAAVAQRATFSVRLGDLRLDRHDALEAGLEIVRHRPENYRERAARQLG